MDFQAVMTKIRKKISSTPLKLPLYQIKSELGSCDTIQKLNHLLRYCEYEACEDEKTFVPSQVMSQILLKRIKLIFLRSKLRNLTSNDLIQIKASLDFCRTNIAKSAANFWHLSLVLIYCDLSDIR